MSGTTQKPVLKSWHLATILGVAPMMAITALAGDLGQLCTNPTFTQALQAGDFGTIALTIFEFIEGKVKGQ